MFQKVVLTTASHKFTKSGAKTILIIMKTKEFLSGLSGVTLNAFKLRTYYLDSLTKYVSTSTFGSNRLFKNDHQGKTIFYLRGSILINLVEKPIYDGND